MLGAMQEAAERDDPVESGRAARVAHRDPYGLLGASRLELRDYWHGLSPVAPKIMYVMLARESDGSFGGTAELSVGEQLRRKESLKVTLPQAVAKRILSTLARAPATPGEYTPWIEHTDDYPDVEIHVEVPAGTITFHSRSQGKDHTPWGLRVSGVEHTVTSPLPARALRLLRRSTAHDRLKSAARELMRRRRS